MRKRTHAGGFRQVASEIAVCPWWLIHSFDNPLRRILQRPEVVLQGLVQPGNRCLDVGCGFGYFTIPMAHLVGPSGSVTAVDLQPEMLEGVRRRAQRNDLLSRIRLHKSTTSGIHTDGPFDFILAFWMLHEVPAQYEMLKELHGLLAPAGHFLLVEPKIHVSLASFVRTVGLAETAGFVRISEPPIFFSRAVLMERGKLAPI